MTAGVLIVGAGQAGLEVATTLRDLGYERAITIVGAEKHGPYQRPPLSKAYLSGVAGLSELSLRDDEFYREHDIRLLLGHRVVDIDVDAGTAVTTRGEALTFERLALTTGARVRRLSCEGADLDGVVYLRDLADAATLAQRLPLSRSVAIVGGGFVGLEVAAAARELGKQVTVLEAQDRLLARALAPEVSAFYLEAHEKRGTRVILNAAVLRVQGTDGRASGVVLGNGQIVEADLVVVGIGVIPRSELAVRLGLTVQGDAIVVDENARTSHSRVVAAGDVTLTPHARSGGMLLRVESVQNAVDQAKVAAHTLMDIPASLDGVPWFWSDQGSIHLRTAGISTGYDDVVIRGDLAAERFTAFYFKDSRLIASDSINRPAEYALVRKLLAASGGLRRADLSDASIPLAQLIE